jgi:DNA repair protein SbcD/Mre11
MAKSAHSPQPILRVLLFSDLLLDRPYEWVSAAVAEARRAAAREVLVELLGAARSHHVDVIACAGGLFDRRTVRPATVQWLIAALRSANAAVLIAPGDGDFIGPLGGYSRHEWPDNVIVFTDERFTPVHVASGVTIWGAAHTEAHRARSFFDGVEVAGDGINLALFHGAERSGLEREPAIEPCAVFDEAAVEAAGFDHALVGHYQHPYFGWMHTYAGAALAHVPGDSGIGAAVLLTLAADGTIDRDHIELTSRPLHDIEVELTGARSVRDAVKRVRTALAECTGVVRLRLTGRVAPDIVLQRDDFVGLVSGIDDLLVVWDAGVDVDVDELANEQTVRGQFVRDVMAARDLTDDRRQRVLLLGLRALAGCDILEGPR